MSAGVPCSQSFESAGSGLPEEARREIPQARPGRRGRAPARPLEGRLRGMQRPSLPIHRSVSGRSPIPGHVIRSWPVTYLNGVNEVVKKLLEWTIAASEATLDELAGCQEGAVSFVKVLQIEARGQLRAPGRKFRVPVVVEPRGTPGIAFVRAGWFRRGRRAGIGVRVFLGIEAPYELSVFRAWRRVRTTPGPFRF